MKKYLYKIIVLVFAILCFAPLFLQTAQAKNEKISYVPDSSEDPLCCFVSYKPSKLNKITGFNEDTVRRIVEAEEYSTLDGYLQTVKATFGLAALDAPFGGKCTSENTTYYNAETETVTGQGAPCYAQFQNCKVPAWSRTGGLCISMLPVLVPIPLPPFFVPVFPPVPCGLPVAIQIEKGEFEVTLYYPPETRIYGEYLGDFRDADNPISTTSPHDNKAYPDKCLVELWDKYAETIPNGAPCAYMVCGIDGYWSSPASLEFTETCTLNPLFRFYDDPQTGLLQTEGISTAIGCFPSTPEGVVTAILRIVMGVAGLIAIGIIISGFVAIMTSGDNPEKVKESYSKITYAALGLLLLVLSVFILRFIGITILNLPNFNI